MLKCSYIIKVRGCTSRISEATLSVKMGLSRSSDELWFDANEITDVSRDLTFMCMWGGADVCFKRFRA
jgi:hypothetical protein